VKDAGQQKQKNMRQARKLIAVRFCWIGFVSKVVFLFLIRWLLDGFRYDDKRFNIAIEECCERK
jgi:small neutral amino acid transporter SnatA (MarC family)